MHLPWSKMSRQPANTIAYFISPHGLGHASRSTAVMAALLERNPAIHFDIFTTIPPWFFQNSLAGNFRHHAVLTDVGLIQHSPLEEDLAGTFRALDHLLPFNPDKIKQLSKKINALGCRLIICDIAPMGIVVAKEAGLPSVLVENFTWDWIYQKYIDFDSSVGKHIEYLKQLFRKADLHIQATPACTSPAVDLVTLPVSRKTKKPSHIIREQLALPEQSKSVLITMGGISEKFTFIERLRQHQDIHFIIPGSADSIKQIDNLHLLPFQSDFYHPDLVNLSDAVIGKIGYSTLAEVFHAGVPFGYIPRSGFRESHKLVEFVKKEMSGFAIKDSEFSQGQWIPRAGSLVDLPKIQRDLPNGADQIADFLLTFLAGKV